jgi:molybdopterin-synthase adenylyltransferase
MGPNQQDRKDLFYADQSFIRYRMRTWSVVIPGKLHEELNKFLLRPDRQEDLCFATYIPSTGAERSTGILSHLILPEDGDREVHHNASFASQFLQRALSIAVERGEGLVFLHSHLGPGWQGMSPDDVRAEERISPAAIGATGYPLLGMTLGTDGAWSARFWAKNPNVSRKYDRVWCATVRVMSNALTLTYHPQLLPARLDNERQMRTISAWGPKPQADLSRLTVGIVGLGSVGSIVAEILARTGFSRFVLIDFDSVERKNLDRLTNVFEQDIGRAKVDAIADGIRRSASAPNPEISACEYSVCEKPGFEAALDCDMLFSCVDRPWPRQALNFIAYAHLIQVIDGGILVRTNKDNTRILGADWKAQTVGYGRVCLECLGQYTAGDAATEKAGYFDDPEYIRGLSRGSSPDVHENVYAFASHLASIEVLQLLSLVLAPSGISNVGQQTFHFVIGRMDANPHPECHQYCYVQTQVGMGDKADVILYGDHRVARKAREGRAAARTRGITQAVPLWRRWIATVIGMIAGRRS